MGRERWLFGDPPAGALKSGPGDDVLYFAPCPSRLGKCFCQGIGSAHPITTVKLGENHGVQNDGRAFAALVSGILACSLVGPAAARDDFRRDEWGWGHGRQQGNRTARSRSKGAATPRAWWRSRIRSRRRRGPHAGERWQRDRCGCGDPVRLNVVEPQFSGIGGGGFMVIHLAKQNKTFVVESREGACCGDAGHVPRPDLHRRLDQWARGGRSGHAHGRGSRAAQVGHQVAALHAASGDQAGRRGLRDQSLPGGQHRQLAHRPAAGDQAIFRLPDGSPLPKAICSSSPTSPRPSA